MKAEVARRYFLRLAAPAAAAIGLLFGGSPYLYLPSDATAAHDVASLPESFSPDAQVIETPTATPSEVPTPGRGMTPSPTPDPPDTATPADTALPTPTTSTPELPDLPPQDDVPAPPGTTVEATIDAAGGRIDSPDGRVVIELPPEAVGERLSVRITHRDVSQLEPIEGHPFMTAWEFEAFAVDRDMARVESFPAGVRIITNYTLDDLRGRSPETLRMWTWDDTLGQWDELPSTHIAGTGIVVTNVNHFSIDAGTADPAVMSPAFLRSFQTNLHTGASEVTLPIELPPGPGGLAPALTLSYSSDRVNEMKSHLAQGSWLGVGWDLSTGSIRTVFRQFGGQGEDERHFVELNGVASEIVQDAPGSDTWHMKQEAFLKVRQVRPQQGQDCTVFQVTGSPTSEPCYWVVTDKSGTEYYFGGTSQGADAASARYYTFYWGSPGDPPGWRRYYYRWDLKKVVDVHGNDITYTYTQQTMTDQFTQPYQAWVFSSYPSEIKYNDDKMKVRFTLAPEASQTVIGYNPAIPVRPDAARVLPAVPLCPAYDPGNGGIRAEETRKLQDIQVEVDAGSGFQPVRKYQFGYFAETSFALDPTQSCAPKAGVLKLKEMKQLGTVGTTPLYTMEFDYINRAFSYPGPPVISVNRPFLSIARNGLGGQAEYTYQEMNPPQSPNWSRVVVTTRALKPGVSGVPDTVTTYDYKNDSSNPAAPLSGPAYYLPAGYSGSNAEFRGFAFVRERREGGYVGAFTEHYFNTTQNEFTTGRETFTDIYKWNAAAEGNPYLAKPPQGNQATRMRQVQYDWQCSPSCSGSSVFVFLAGLTTYEGQAGTPIDTRYLYDARGNLFFERQRGRTDTAADDRTVYRPFHNTDPHWLSVPILERVYQGDYASQAALDENEVRKSTLYFYDGSNDHIWGPPSNGKLTGIERSDLQPTPSYSSVYFLYDAFGNKKDESIPTGERIYLNPNGGLMPSTLPRTSWVVYSGTLNTYPRDISNPLGHLTKLTWDLGLGTVKKREEPTGRIVEFAYDNYGRLEKSWDNLTNSTDPSIKYSYEWSCTNTPCSVPNSTVAQRRSDTGASPTYLRETHCFDGLGREVQVRRGYKGGVAPKDAVVQANYSSRGLVRYQAERLKTRRRTPAVVRRSEQRTNISIALSSSTTASTSRR